jgi:hypothetical protein
MCCPPQSVTACGVFDVGPRVLGQHVSVRHFDRTQGAGVKRGVGGNEPIQKENLKGDRGVFIHSGRLKTRRHTAPTECALAANGARHKVRDGRFEVLGFLMGLPSVFVNVKLVDKK